MHDADNSSKSIKYFRKKMEKDYHSTMHLPRGFANKADDLLGDLLLPVHKRPAPEENKEQDAD